MSFVKGMFVGLLLGAAAGAVVEMNPSRRKHGKRMLGRCVRNVGRVVEGVSCALGL